jgi:hypothetical protein
VANKIKSLPEFQALPGYYNHPWSTEFLDRWASQLKVGYDPIRRELCKTEQTVNACFRRKSFSQGGEQAKSLRMPQEHPHG